MKSQRILIYLFICFYLFMLTAHPITPPDSIAKSPCMMLIAANEVADPEGPNRGAENGRWTARCAASKGRKREKTMQEETAKRNGRRCVSNLYGRRQNTIMMMMVVLLLLIGVITVCP